MHIGNPKWIIFYILRFQFHFQFWSPRFTFLWIITIPLENSPRISQIQELHLVILIEIQNSICLLMNGTFDLGTFYFLSTCAKKVFLFNPFLYLLPESSFCNHLINLSFVESILKNWKSSQIVKRMDRFSWRECSISSIKLCKCFLN